MKHVPIATASVLVLALPAGLAAAAVTQTQATPQPIYAAFSFELPRVREEVPST